MIFENGKFRDALTFSKAKTKDLNLEGKRRELANMVLLAKRLSGRELEDMKREMDALREEIKDEVNGGE